MNNTDSEQGMTPLLQRIKEFEDLLAAMREETRQAHAALHDMRHERKEVERLFLGKDVKQMVEDRVDEVIKTELDRIAPEVRAQSRLIYEKVGKEIDRLIDLAMGKEFAKEHNREDMRPVLAAKLKEWLKEQIDEVVT